MWLSGVRSWCVLALVCAIPFSLSKFSLRDLNALTVAIKSATRHNYGNVIFSPVVNTTYGPVQGHLANSRNGTKYWRYLSIPFARPPLEDLRFQPPLPPDPWKKVRKVMQVPPACVNFDPVVLGKAWGKEDCLLANVFVPAAPPPKNGFPVLVYIYGGAFVQGQSSWYEPEYIMDHSVIVYTFNYRLGPSGFLNFAHKSNSSYPSGNAGLKDQLMALKFLNNNVRFFGGNPENITLMGDSAGSSSVHIHMLSPASKGLFNAAILFSGFAFSQWSFRENGTELAFSYGARLGCDTRNVEELFKCYQNFDAFKLVEKQDVPSHPVKHTMDLFGPSLEIGSHPDAILKTPPVQLQPHSGIRLLAGLSSADGVVRTARFNVYPEELFEMETNFGQSLSRVLIRHDNFAQAQAEQIHQFYGIPTYHDNQDKWTMKVTDIFTDNIFSWPLHLTAVAHAKTKSPTYLFLYDYRPRIAPGTYSVFGKAQMEDGWIPRYVKLVLGVLYDWVNEYVIGQQGTHKFGVGHVESILQLWNLKGMSGLVTWADIEFSEDFVQLIVNFVKGEPTLTWRGKVWPQVELKEGAKPKLPFMKLDNAKHPKILDDPYRRSNNFWRTIEH